MDKKYIALVVAVVLLGLVGALAFGAVNSRVSELEVAASAIVEDISMFDVSMPIVGEVSEITAGSSTVNGVSLVDGAADAVQLTVQGYTTQTNSLLVLEQSDGTDKFNVGNTGVVTAAGEIVYGANDLYPVGFASGGQQLVYGTSSMTGTESVAHGLTTVTYCMATLGEDPTNGGGDAAHVSVAVSGNACTVKAWQDDFITAATETDVVVQWVVVGAP